MNTLVIGAPGAGKTSWCKTRLNGGILYDLDLIAAALLGWDGSEALPHPTDDDARLIANQLLMPITEAAKRCCTDLTVIRTAPGAEEVAAIAPNRVVWIRSESAEARMGTWTRKILMPTVNLIELMYIPVEEIGGRP